MKLAQRDEMKEQQRRKKEGLEDVDTDPEGGVNEGEADVDGEAEGDLFGPDDPAARMEMDIV